MMTTFSAMRRDCRRTATRRAGKPSIVFEDCKQVIEDRVDERVRGRRDEDRTPLAAIHLANAIGEHHAPHPTQTSFVRKQASRDRNLKRPPSGATRDPANDRHAGLPAVRKRAQHHRLTPLRQLVAGGGRQVEMDNVPARRMKRSVAQWISRPTGPDLSHSPWRWPGLIRGQQRLQGRAVPACAAALPGRANRDLPIRALDCHLKPRGQFDLIGERLGEPDGEAVPPFLNGGWLGASCVSTVKIQNLRSTDNRRFNPTAPASPPSPAPSPPYRPGLAGGSPCPAPASPPRR